MSGPHFGTTDSMQYLTLRNAMLALAAAALAALVFGAVRMHHTLTVLAGISAKTACSATLVSHLDFDTYLAYIAERDFTTGLELTLDKERRRVVAEPWIGETRVGGAAPAHGLHRDFCAGGGRRAGRPFAGAGSQAGGGRVAAQDRSGRAACAVDAHMADNQNSHAVVLWHDGAIRAEAYSPLVGDEAPLLGWSMTKSLAHAMVGVLVRDGLLRLDQKDLLEQWRQDEDDERRQISLEDLLRMSSGLEFDENYTSVANADTILMLFLERDAAAYAADKPLQHEIGQHWSYSSGTTNILGRVMTEALQRAGKGPLMPYMQRELLDPLGIGTMLVETDAAGNPVLSSFGHASGRDWLRLGLLYLNDGVWDGKRLLPPGFAATAHDLTPNSDGEYGLHFWLNRPRANGELHRPDLPQDIFSMSGFDGQYVIIMPTQRVVIVRVGLAPRPDPNEFAYELLRATIPSYQGRP